MNDIFPTNFNWITNTRINANVTLNTTIPESCPAANMFRVG